ncbi:MAG: hypothetical protein ACO1RX_05465 [Candidatus Sericytochromatia bacterium]
MQPELKFEKLNPPYFAQFEALVAELQRYPEQRLHLELDIYQQFVCTQCGECCKLPWAIQLTQEYYERWYSVFDQHPSGRFHTPFLRTQEGRPENYAHMRRVPGSSHCIFLEADDTCFIHTEYGPDALSYVCKEYPRAHKRIGHQYRSRSLLHSCEAVPELLEHHEAIVYRFDSPQAIEPLVTGYQAAGYPGRFETYLWLGLALDLMGLEQPLSPVARWRLMLPVLEWMEGFGVESLTAEQLRWIYQEALSQAPFRGLEPSSLRDRERLFNLSLRLFGQHPGLVPWLRALLSGQRPWPLLDDTEQALLGLTLTRYLHSRLVALPYPDAFMGKLNLWQSCLMLSLQLTMLQWLALYYRDNSGAPLNQEQLNRALVFVGYRFEQRTVLVQELRLREMTFGDCLEAMQILLGLDLASPFAW